MDKLYAPWRNDYVMTHGKQTSTDVCIFCRAFDLQESAQERYILLQDADIMILLNLYPYNGGHLLVVPKIHVEHLHDLPNNILAKMITACAASTKILEQAISCNAFNVGLNIGRTAGAGIPQHIHMHIVPRFVGDTGFFTTIGETKQISINLTEMYRKLLPHFEKIKL